MALPHPDPFDSGARPPRWTEISALLAPEERHGFAADHADGKHAADRRFGCERCDADRVTAKSIR